MKHRTGGISRDLLILCKSARSNTGAWSLASVWRGIHKHSQENAGCRFPPLASPHPHTEFLFFSQEPESCLGTGVVHSTHLLCSSLGLQTGLSTALCSALTPTPLKCSEGHASRRVELHVQPIRLGAGPYALRIQRGSLLSLSCLPAAGACCYGARAISMYHLTRGHSRESVVPHLAPLK